MNIFKIWKSWLCCAWMPFYFGGDSSSTTEQKQVTETQDNRIAAAQDSTNLNASRATVGRDINLTTVSTDHDTVHQSFDFAKRIAQDAADTNAAALSVVNKQAISAIEAVKTAYRDENDKLANAYTEAKAGEQKILVGGTLLIGGIVAIMALKKG